MFGWNKQKNQTFKQTKRNKDANARGGAIKNVAGTTVGAEDIRMAISLPEGEDLKSWIAVKTAEFFTEIGMLYATLGEFCTAESCPRMSAGPGFEYLWADAEKGIKPYKCAAPEYINLLMDWAQKQFDDEELFPSQTGAQFPKRFVSEAKVILRRLFRVYAHIYHHHFDQVVTLGEEAHLNTSFKHFVLFVQEYDLVPKAELTPLEDLIYEFNRQEDAKAGAALE